MVEADLNTIKSFFRNYQAFNREQVKSFKAQFEEFKSCFIQIEGRAIQEAKFYAPGFNVFSILGLSRYEERTHSAMLAHLLRPNASHGQIDLFLNKFFLLLEEAFPGFPLPEGKLSEGKWIVQTEVYFGNGRMDILLSSPDLNCLYVIENKIDASEQEGQLSRYAEWMRTKEEEYPTQALLFLTPTGYEAMTASKFLYFSLSYHKHIAGWLASCVDKIQAPNVKEVVIQYKELVKKI
jgi:hypothetical protein